MKKCTETGKPSKRWKKVLLRILLTLLALFLVCAIIVGVSALVCDTGLAVHTYDMTIDKIEQPFTAVLLTDLHGKEYGENNERLLEKVREQAPDVIFCVGDMIDESADDAEVDRFCTLLKKLGEIAPVYVAYGNHEQSYMKKSGQDLAPRITETGAILFDETCDTVDIAGNKICLGGTMGYLYLFGRTREQYWNSKEVLLMQEMEASGLPTIVLAHLPDTIIFCEAYKDWNIDLFLSGHTHGGIIQIPFIGGLYAPMQGYFPDEDMGYYNYGRVQLVISSGLAGHGKVPRIFNMPEVCVLHISG